MDAKSAVLGLGGKYFNEYLHDNYILGEDKSEIAIKTPETSTDKQIYESVRSIMKEIRVSNTMCQDRCRNEYLID